MSTVLSPNLLPEVQQFLDGNTKCGFVGGQDVKSTNGETFTTSDPGSGETIAEVYALQANDVDRAIDVARDAFKQAAWARLPQNERSAMLHRLG